MTGSRRKKYESRARGSGWVHRVPRPASTRLGSGGFTLIEVVMTMVLLSVGLLTLAPLMVSVVQGNRFAQHLTMATSLAEDRLEEITNHNVFADITAAKYPSEAQGEIRNGDSRYARYARAVTIVDSLDVLARSVLKSVTVTVSWTGIGGQARDVTLFGRVARF